MKKLYTHFKCNNADNVPI